MKDQLDWSKLDSILGKLSTSSSQIDHFDENDDFTFLDSNKNLLNTTDQTVYVVCSSICLFLDKLFSLKNDHQYYNVSYIIPKSEGLPLYYVEDRPQFIRIDALADRHRSAFVRQSMKMKSHNEFSSPL